MQFGRVVGQAISTVKHPTLKGWKVLLVQPLTSHGTPDGEPILVLDNQGAGLSDTVIVSSDGATARKMVGAKDSPVRWFVLGVCDR